MVQGATVLTLDSSELQAAGGSYTLTEGINSGYGNFSVTMALDAQAFQNAILAGNVKANIFSANNNMIGLGLNYVSSELPRRAFMVPGKERTTTARLLLSTVLNSI